MCEKGLDDGASRCGVAAGAPNAVGHLADVTNVPALVARHGMALAHLMACLEGGAKLLEEVGSDWDAVVVRAHVAALAAGREWPGEPITEPVDPTDERRFLARVEMVVNEDEMCGRVLIGRGGDSWDPTCVLPFEHEGTCRPAADVYGPDAA